MNIFKTLAVKDVDEATKSEPGSAHVTPSPERLWLQPLER